MPVPLDRILMTEHNGQKIMLYILCYIFFAKHCNFKI